MSGFDAVTHLIYLASAASFVLGLHLMNSPATARRGKSRTEWAEDLQWALLNKLDFLFNY